MRSLAIGVGLAAWMSGVAQCPSALARDGASPLRAAQIDALVESALAADLAGDSSAKQALLDKAQEASPASPAPHWHRGEVRYDGQWRSVAEVERLAAADRVRQEYRARLEHTSDTLDDHRSLAQWCEQRGLQDEARWHWRTVLRIDPDHVVAQGRLGLKSFEGGLFTKQEIAVHTANAEQREADFKKYSKELADWLREATTRDAAARNEVFGRIARVREPAAMAALEDAAGLDAKDMRRLARRLGREGAEEFAEKLQLAVVAAFAAMSEHEATVRLTEIAVLAMRPGVRREAAEALRARPETDYVPMLMDALEAPIEAHVDVVASPDGNVSYDATFVRHGPQGDRRHSVSQTDVVVAGVNSDGIMSPRAFYRSIARSAQDAANRAAAVRRRVADVNYDIGQRNQLVVEALRTVTGDTVLSDAQQWWTAWQTYNELNVSYQRPTYETEDVSYSLSMTSAPQPTPQTPPGGGCECFAAGTSVWTQTGVKPIEQVGVGELVLSQDPRTGELAYCPVLQTTSGPSARFVRIGIEEEEIVATPGHRFWVVGEGWKMAKFLQAEIQLHGLQGGGRVREVAGFEGDDAYNLVVDQFHTYFVGRSRLLVHDIGCPLPTRSAIPGLRKDADVIDSPLSPGQIEGVYDSDAAAF